MNRNMFFLLCTIGMIGAFIIGAIGVEHFGINIFGDQFYRFMERDNNENWLKIGVSVYWIFLMIFFWRLKKRKRN